MTLAAILVISFLALGSPGSTTHDQAAPAPQTQTPPAQNSKSSVASKQPNATQPAPKRRIHPRKNPDCSMSSSTKPCPPPKVVVKNGGSDEPTVQLKGDTPPAKASNERLNTEQLRLATEENLKKITSRQLTANQQDMVNQIKQFMDQSKAAVADGDLDRGHNLAMKARLLSDELVNP
ncbi:MAG: hypothetical protein ABR874_01670 [Candidatus Sulfotelmatobacter sp.]|jgi:hypothetical protein